MDYNNFIATISDKQPPVSVSSYLQALWYDAKGYWEQSHNIVQDIHDDTGSWIHAYLHRKEGDTGNARYWYSRAGRPFPGFSLQEEWEQMVKELLEAGY
ncbi:MAG: hypothetical protein KIT80_07285 [Chitinophagaceae bacterium]|nr:hypothetical protein [Chitinophagaceae bacterium]MCW5926694.1 hypothetical protein [Chitinophagaceae bacterium]